MTTPCRDLALGRRLADGSATVADVATLGTWPLKSRAPYLGAVLARIGDADPAMRAAAISALRGARAVPGVRAIVAALDDVATRDAALEALVDTAREAPDRYVHALFHADVAIRRAAIPQTPHAATDMLAYLRADPACADLVAGSVWPRDGLPLAFDLYATGRLTDRELVVAIASTPTTVLRAFFLAEHGRRDTDVEAYLEAAATGGATTGPAPGIDVLDQAFAAIAGAGVDLASQVRDPQHAARWANRALETVIESVVTNKPGPLTRRAATSLLGVIARRPSPALVGTCCALEPRIVALPTFDPAHADAAAAGLVRFKWPVRLTTPQVERLLLAPLVRGNLALAAAVAGLFTSRRLRRLAKLLGEDAILDALVASDRGWDEVCHLPPEMPALELAWLVRLEARDLARYHALVAATLLVFTGKRLEGVIDQTPRRHRAQVFAAVVARRELAVDDPRLSTVCRTIASRLDRAQVLAMFAALLADPTVRGPAIALVLARAVEPKLLTAVAGELSDDAAERFVAILDGPDALPRDREIAIAVAFAGRPYEPVAAWGRRVSATPAAQIPSAVPAVRARRALTDVEQLRIATCPEGALELALQPALGAPVSGLAEALAQRARVPNPLVCAALLGCADPLVEVARQLDRFSEGGRAFENQIDALSGVMWHTAADLSPLTHARLWRWEAHDYALARWLETFPSTLAALEMIEALPGRFAAHTLWTGIAEVFVVLRYRDPARFEKLGSEALAMFVAERVDRHIGLHAARILISLVEGGIIGAARVRAIVLDRAADADALTREFLIRIARLDGIAQPPKVDLTPPPPELIDEVRACTDPVQLLAWCAHTRRTVVQEAVLQLLLLGEAGHLLLAGVLARLGDLAAPVPILESIALWESEEALARARALVDQSALAPEWQFHLCLGLVARAFDAGLIERAFAAARAPAEAWFRRRDWEQLVELVGEDRCARELASAPHHHAYQAAVRVLLESWDVLPAHRDALVRFLEVDRERPLMLRRDVTRRVIKDYADLAGLPILVEELCDEQTTEGEHFLETLQRALVTLGRESVLVDIAETVVSAALGGGEAACSEKRMWSLLQQLVGVGVSHAELAPLYARILEEAATPAARRAAAPHVVTEIEANEKLRRVAEVFAWGVRRGVELTGRLYRIHMTSDERDLGYTYLDQTKIFVSPLAMLRGEMHGRDIVEGLVLHELGHHVYHRGEGAAAIWKRAHDEGLGRLLNLVADEHLERNLRGVDRAYGDRLKRLGAYAFQHAAQEIRVSTLLECLRGSAAPALIATPLEVAFDESSVKLRRGAVLGELDRLGHPLARFARALRLGLGNRHDDPRVAAALALCNKDLRKLDMPALYEITKQLASLFGGAAGVARVFGGPEDLTDGDRERDVHGAGLDDDILQREVERILDPRRGRIRTGPLGPRDRLQINVNPDEHFERISSVERVRGVAAVHHRMALQVARHAARLRGHLDDLGLRYERAHARLQGHTLDRARLRALVTRNDPRILIARTPVRRTDLFLGTLIDCSSSMTAGDNIERARQFAVLITEAVRQMPGVEARFFGFTDSVIYDAGDARDCGVTGLEADGGNNDAAGLFHAANVAASSRKRAKVLVMISDGLPTSCSVASLRGLVTQLTRRRGIVCAQVAVRRLEEECFPHYIVLDDDAIDVAVARFGRMIADLTRRALGA